MCWYIINSYYTTVVGREKQTSALVLGHTGERMVALPGVTVQEMLWFFEIIVQLGHDQKDMMEDNWLTVDQYFTGFYCNILKQDGLYHMLRFIHFSDNINELDKTHENSNDCGK